MTHLKPIAVLALILAATLEMRGPITAVGPLAGRLTSELGLSASEYGLAAALPIAAFGLFSFAAPGAARRFGLYGAVIIFLGVLAAGGFVRTAPSYPALLLGTLLIGVGIAALNVLMPVVVKTQNEAKTGALLGIYTGVVGLSGSIGALTSHPLAALTDFTQSTFLAWAAFGTVVLALWLVAFGRSSGPSAMLLRAPSLRRHPGAWAVTAVMGLQSLLIYTVAAWLPPYLQTQGVSADAAGAALALYLVSGLPASILTDRFMKHCGSEWASEALMSLSYLAGLWFWTLGGPWIFLGSILAGAPQGSMLSVAFILMARKTRSSAHMLGLSALSQGVGYLGAASVPSSSPRSSPQAGAPRSPSSDSSSSSGPSQALRPPASRKSIHKDDPSARSLRFLYTVSAGRILPIRPESIHLQYGPPHHVPNRAAQQHPEPRRASA